MDANAAAANSVNLPPPAQLPPLPDQNGLPSLPPAPATGLPELPPAAPNGSGLPSLPPAPSAGTGLPTLPSVQPTPASIVTLPTLPTAVPGTPIPTPGLAPEVTLPSGTVVVPDAPAPELPQAHQSESGAIISDKSGHQVPATFTRYEQMALRQHPLPRVTPDTPLIPGPSLAETVNQNRQPTTLPGSGGDTNYAYATIGGPEGPAKPMPTPPRVVETVVGSDIGKDYPPLQAVMPNPQRTPVRWDEAGSAFATPVSAQALNYYVSPYLHRNMEQSAILPSAPLAEVIVLRGGQEFQGTILERGNLWKIELVNGTVITVPGNKVAHTRKILAAPTHTPGESRSMTFPTQQWFKEETRGIGNF